MINAINETVEHVENFKFLCNSLSFISYFILLYDLYSSPNIVWVIKSRMRWAGHGEERGVYRVFVGKPE
jgi:hypothetical protein